ncbi:alkaline phosphatase PhoX [Sphaerisporangium perillae]|uniref:alkaline phosphatase PhoX n=1 Tax=Sphaerisporangium perillae TaxID=2935860 RepID=UPI00200DABD0|nr:alkaline phosphatase PhoX [Sphaerisporangium perillae]
MPSSRVRTALVGATAVIASLAASGVAFADHGAGSKSTTTTGPTTTVAPYVLPVAKGVSVTSLLTVADKPAANGYQMVGIPDGLGAYRSGRDLILYMNQELRATQGLVRAHGQKGAFVSKLQIDPRTGAVKSGSDLITSVNYWDYPGQKWASAPVAPAGAAADTHTSALARFCSGYLAPAGTLSNGHKGYAGRVYFANEETGDEGRVFGVTDDGVATQLPRLGLLGWENTLVAANKSDTTLVVGNEDVNTGQLRIYAGRKQSTGSAVEKAGLTNGTLGVLDVASHAVATDAEFRAKYGKNTPVKVAVSPLDWTKNGVQQNADAAKSGLTLNRIEDGAFDPRRPNDYYFVTTGGGDTTASPTEPGVARDGGGLWRLRFADIERPEKGGTLTLLLDGSEAPYLNMPDNITIDQRGNLLIQEDTGNNPHLGRIVAYRIADGARGVLAQFDPKLFSPTANSATFLTQDEESSGIIPNPSGGPNSFLFDAQIHTDKGLPAGTGPGTVEEYVERGQLLSLTVQSWSKVYTAQ